MAVEAYIPTFGIVTGTALIDSINPCAIGVLILMLSVLFTKKKTNMQIFILGVSYITAVFGVYLLAGLGLLYFLSSIPLYITEYLSIFIGVLIIGAGLLEIKDYFWYGQGLSLMIPHRVSKRLPKLSNRSTILGVMMLGAFVSAVELPCTGAPYLAIISFLSQNFDFTAFLLLVWYNVVFVSPLIVILILSLTGVKLQKINHWKMKNRKYMRLAIGLMLVILGWLLILIANGTINFG
jgi:cytochrome c biogenesis protein CcdA